MIIIFFSLRNISVAVAIVAYLLLNTGCREITTAKSKSWVLITKDDSNEDIIHKAAQVTPSNRQMEWQRKEFLAFIHFNLFTYRDDEGENSPILFNPSKFDARQWVQVCKNTGMKMIILTAKHHQGFCLWPSAYTDYSVKASPWKNGSGDIVKEVADACHEANLEFGVYLSPWDMHEPSYGAPSYDEYFKNQLRELLTNYGPIAEVWFDGHYGGTKGEKHDYKWNEYYGLIRTLQPNAVIAISGPDVRWVGNEKGYARESEWSVVPISLDYSLENTKEISVIDNLFPSSFKGRTDDLGSRKTLKEMIPPYYLVWSPAETDVSIRPSWSYKANEKPESLEKLLDIYYNSVGRNSVLLMNFAPNGEGLIPEEDILRVQEFRTVIDSTFKQNLAYKADVKASSRRKDHLEDRVVDDKVDTYWMTDKGVDKATIEFDLGSEKIFNRVLLQEYIQEGQRIEEFYLETWDGKQWKEFAKGTTVGYKRILRFNDITTSKVRLNITQSRDCPTLNNFGLFFQPPLGKILN